MWGPSQQSHANTSPGGWAWASAWPLCSGRPGPGLAGGEGGPGRELLSAVNKQQKTELPGFFLVGGCILGQVGGLPVPGRGSSHQQDHIPGLSTGTSVVPAQLPSRWAVPVPVPPGVLRCPPSLRTIPTQSHSLCNFYFNQEVIKSMYSLKTV